MASRSRPPFQTLLRIAADPKHLGARIGMTGVLHTWGSALTHHPHVHSHRARWRHLARNRRGGRKPGRDTKKSGRWISCRPGFFLPVRVLSRLFRRLFLEPLAAAHEAGRLRVFGAHRRLADSQAFAAHPSPLRKLEWVVYAKRPFAGPEAVLAYLSRYTHRVAISNSRPITLHDKGFIFTWKDYRTKGRGRRKVMTWAAHEFIRRVLIMMTIPKARHPNAARFHRRPSIGEGDARSKARSAHRRAGQSALRPTSTPLRSGPQRQRQRFEPSNLGQSPEPDRDRQPQWAHRV